MPAFPSDCLAGAGGRWSWADPAPDPELLTGASQLSPSFPASQTLTWPSPVQGFLRELCFTTAGQTPRGTFALSDKQAEILSYAYM